MTSFQIAPRLPARPRQIGAVTLSALLALAPMAALAQDTNDSPPPAGESTSAAPASADAATGSQRSATARMTGPAGESFGTVTVAETASGQIHLTFALEGLPEGTRAIHIHETGSCEPPGFDSAGGHLAGGREHGAEAPGGMHAGDLPNITIGSGGSYQGEVLTDNVSMDEVMDGDGSAIVIHAGADDYASQPAGNAGDRIACGALE